MNFAIKKISITTVLLGLLGVLFFISCGKDGISEEEADVRYHRSVQLRNIYDNEITNLTQAFVEATELLRQSAEDFQKEITLSHLRTAQERWKSIQLIWKQLELYDLGTVGDSFIAFEINRWPTDETKINANIEGSETINIAFINSKGSSSKGISAVEYLIFSSNDPTEILTAFSSEENATRRMQYLVAVTENLNHKAFDLKNLWESYQNDFTTSLQNGISGSQNQIINAMVTLIEEIIISKLGSALGDTNGGVIEVERLEAHRSEFSKEIIKQHLRALQRCYTGDFEATPFRVGFDRFLINIGREKLALNITEQFLICEEKLIKIKDTLEQELVNNPEAVLEVKNAFRDLLVLIKVDMANILGSTITFNDNDGD